MTTQGGRSFDPRLRAARASFECQPNQCNRELSNNLRGLPSGRAQSKRIWPFAADDVYHEIRHLRDGQILTHPDIELIAAIVFSMRKQVTDARSSKHAGIRAVACLFLSGSRTRNNGFHAPALNLCNWNLWTFAGSADM